MSQSISSIKSLDEPLDNKIYKVKQLVNNKLNTIYVFYGRKQENAENEEIIKKIFTEQEYDEIKSNKTKIVFSEETIHPDDTIATIKIKIINQINKDIAIEEIYLFCKKIEKLNSVAIYQSLTQNAKLSLTKVRLDQFIQNITDLDGNPLPEPEDKDVYTYDDIFEMHLDNKEYIVNNALGQKFFIVENEYPYVCNPFSVETYDKFFEQNSRKSLSTLNNHLLLSSGKIVDDSIYLCFAKDVLTYADSQDISVSTTLKIYYPFLYNKNINSLEDLERQTDALIKSNAKINNQKAINTFNTINMFYDIYKLRKNELNYISRGIKFVRAVMKPDFDVKIPLEIIFKIVHATDTNPLIKYNPSSRQENIFRLYADKLSTDGRKIPYLKKAAIFKLMRVIGRNKSVSIYIETHDSQMLNCEFDEEGYITMSAEFNNIVNVSQIDDIFRTLINPIIQEIKSTLEQSGYKLNLFNSLNDANVEIKQMTYETNVIITKPFNIEKYKGCIASVFINETDKNKGNKTNLRFKRVSNFSQFTSIEAFILEQPAKGLRGYEIIQELLNNYPELTQEEATELVQNVARELDVERGVRKSDIKIKENPGFKTEASVNLETATLKIVTENINNLNYLYTLPVYLDTIIRLTQDKTSTKYPLSEINRLCGAEETIDITFPDITSSSEESFEEGEDAEIEGDETIAYKKFTEVEKDKPKGAFSLFFEDYDESQDSYKSEGGQPSSEESVTSDSDDVPNNKKLTYNGITLPTGISSEESITSDSNNDMPIVIKKPSSSSESSAKQLESMSDMSSSEESESSDQKLSSIKKPTSSEESESSEQKLSSIKKPTSSEESESSEQKLSSIKKPTSSKESESSDQKLSSIKKPTSSESSESSEQKLSPIKKPTSSEESVPSDTQSSDIKIDLSIQKSKSTMPSSEEKQQTKKQLIIESDSEEDSSSKTSSKKTTSSSSKTEDSEKQAHENNEEEEDDEKEEEEEEEEIRNIDGMKLNKPYYFQTQIEKKDPILIVKEDTPEYNAYSRTCLSDKRRQPVILTDLQLDKINKEHPGFLREQDVLKYGSDEKHQFNYICPRYWCLKNNKIIDPADIKLEKGEYVHRPKKGPSCGKVLPKNQKEVKPGYYIYEFNDEGYPGLIPDKHPKGLCLPCCFKNYNTEGRIKAKKSCLKEEMEKDKTKRTMEVEKKEDNYILGPDKFPLEAGRWGYLPAEMQTMLHEVNADCQVSKTNTNIKANHPCLLRHGIEISRNQSFVAAISDALFYGKKLIDENNKLTNKIARVLTIKEMRDRIIKAINIDLFIKYQNGNLVTDFQDIERKVDLSKYKKSKLYSKINMENQEEKMYFSKVVSAFENFLMFLNDDDALIDHTYLWDIISMPNKYLFPNGINLVIFQIPHDDITNNVQLICPTNHYSNEFYQTIKPTLILIKEDGYYEPIYSYITDGTDLKIAKEFKERDPHLSKTMRAVFKELIKPFFEEICKPQESMPNIYSAIKPILLYELVQKLDKYNYKIKKLVMNFNNKIIGLIAEEPGMSEKSGFVPCYPSALNENLKKELDYVFMNNLDLWNTYNETVTFLNKIDKRTSKRREKNKADIPCKPAFKIVEDEMVVGILTNTNQFIQISEPIHPDEINADNDLPSITDEDYIVNSKDKNMKSSDIEIMTQQTVDKEREDYIKKIKLETSFYNVFRNTIRILINKYENIKIKEKIEVEMLKEYILYSDKLDNINKLLRELVSDKIQFIGDENYYKLINEVSTCIVKDKDKCKATPNLCVVTENGKCNLILPERNLITNKQNEPIYFGRMSDELIRYNRIKSFMLQPQTYLSFGNIGYNLRDNEIILVQSTLTQEYFESLIPTVTNKYIKQNSYDETQPIISQIYENRIPSLDHAIGRKNEMVCYKTPHDKITSSIWKKCFPDNYKEDEYSDYNFCTFNFIIELIERKTNKKYVINDIKNQLYDEYKKYIAKNHDKLLDILITEGKKTLGDQVYAGTLSFASFIYTDNYFLTTFDLWLLVNKYEIPTIFICQKCILETNYEKQEFVGYGDKNDKFAFIIIPGFRHEHVPKYRLVKSDKDEIFISLDNLNEDCLKRIENAINDKVSIEDYLNNFRIVKKTIYEKKKCLLVDSDTEDEEIKPKKKKIILEKTSEISPEEFITKPKKQTKKIEIKGEPQNRTKRQLGINKRRILIADSNTEKV
jgi:hypothetical protein